MNLIDIFENFSADFEETVKDDDWSRLEKYFTEDATYLNVGGPDPKSIGREAIINFLKNDVEINDRKFDGRCLVAITPPKVKENGLSREWRCTYTLTGVPDLVVEGEARYLFEGDLIKKLEEEVTEASAQNMAKWMQEYGNKLRA